MSYISRWIARAEQGTVFVNLETGESIKSYLFRERYPYEDLCEGALSYSYVRYITAESTIIYMALEAKTDKVLGILFINNSKYEPDVWKLKLLCGAKNAAKLLKAAIFDWESTPYINILKLECSFDLISYYKRYGFKLGKACDDDLTPTTEFPEHPYIKSRYYTKDEVTSYKGKYSHFKTDAEEEFNSDTMFTMIKCKNV